MRYQVESHVQGISLRADGRSLVGPLHVEIELVSADGQLDRRRLALQPVAPAQDGGPLRLESRELAALRVGLLVQPHDHGVLLLAQLTPTPPGGGAGAVTLRALEFVATPDADAMLHGVGQTDDWRLFLAGYNSFSPAIVRDSREQFRPPRVQVAATFNQHAESVYFGRDDCLSTPWYATFTRVGRVAATASDPMLPTQPTLLCGWLTAQVGLGEIAIRRGAATRWEARLSFGDMHLTGDQTLQCDPLLIGLSAPGQGEALLDAYVNEVAECMGARRTTSAAPSGWCSWYYYYTRVSAEHMRKNLAALRGEGASLPVRYVQLDDGYQPSVGDWLSPNEKFGASLSSLGQLAADIRAAGFLPGIWVAPFIVQRSSKVFSQHPDWILADPSGKRRRVAYHYPWGITNGQIYALDLSHPAVLAHLEHVFRTLREQGFAYFKIDFLSAGLRNGKRHNPAQSPVQAFRNALLRIREAVGDDYIVGCGAPILPAVGICDGLRVSSDVKEVWRDPKIAFFAGDCGHPSAELALWNDLTRAHLHRRWFINDPDCLLVRERDTSLSQPEIQTLCSVLAQSGGALFLSDDMSRLASDRLSLAQQTLPVHNRGPNARTLGVLTEKRPYRMVRTRDVDGQQDAIAVVVNWADTHVTHQIKATDLGLSDGTYHAYEHWTGTYQLLTPSTAMSIALPAHGSAHLVFRPLPQCPLRRQPRPTLIAATHHLGMIMAVDTREVWDPERAELTFSLQLGARRSGDLLIGLPDGYSVIDATANSPARIREVPVDGPNGLCRFTLHIDDSAHVRLRFKRTSA